MSWQSLADVFEYVQRTDDLSSSEVLVLLALANFTDHQGANAFPSQRTLRTITKLARRTLQYTLRTLEQRAVLITHLQRGRRGSTEYTLHLPRVILKGARGAPSPQEKGAAHDTEKAHHVHPDPGSEIQDTSTAKNPGTDDLHSILHALGLSPDSNIYQWSITGADRGAAAR